MMYYSARSLPWTKSPQKVERFRQKSRQVKDRAKLIAEACRKYQISRAEYERRFEEWKALRRMVEQIRNQHERAEFREQVAFALEDRRVNRALFKSELEARTVLDDVKPIKKDKNPLLSAFPGAVPDKSSKN